MKHQGQFWNHAAIGMELPGESRPGGLLVELLDGNRVLIEGHNGLIYYGLDSVRVKTGKGNLDVSGNELQINLISKYQLVICGQISNIKLCRRC